MKARLAAAMGFLLVNVWGIPAHAQNTTVGDIKGKGATVLSAEEVKALLTDATVRYENAENRTQMKLSADGVVAGSAQKKVGSAGGAQIQGKWNVNEQGRWCAEVGGSTTSGAKYCRTVLKAEGKYYYVTGAANDDTRAAVEFTVSK